MRRAFAFALALLGCAPAPAAPPPSTPPASVRAPVAPVEAVADPPGSRPATDAEARLLARLLAETETLRGLRFTGPVAFTVQTPRAIAQSLTADLEEEELEETRFVYATLGLLDPATDVRALLASVVADQVVGYYDTERERLVVRDDVLDTLRRPGEGEAQMVLVHELVHALQDQRFGLPDDEDDLDSDAANAFRGLAEGDATLTMALRGALRSAGGLAVAEERRRFVLSRFGERLGAVDTETLLEAFAAPGQDALADAPTILRTTLVMPYLYGLRFCARLASNGDFTRIDAAFRAPPGSSELVMHPEKYLAGEGFDAIALPALPSLDAAGWEEVAEDTLGELELGVFLGRRAGDVIGRGAVDRGAAAGWSGDRLRIYRRGEAGAAVWLTSWDDAREASEAEAAVLGARTERQGRALVVLMGLDEAEGAAVLETLEPALATLQREGPAGARAR
ncbi:MAG: hypothetical protein AAGH15_19710 [Myxococcota bacterium]